MFDITNGFTRIGAISYSKEVKVNFYLNDYKTNKQAMLAIGNIQYMHGTTNTADAITKMYMEVFRANKGDRPEVSNVCILITDGKSDCPTKTMDAITATKSNNITMFAIKIGHADVAELEKINRIWPNHLFSMHSFQELTVFVNFTQIFHSYCATTGRYTMTSVNLIDRGKNTRIFRITVPTFSVKIVYCTYRYPFHQAACTSIAKIYFK